MPPPAPRSAAPNPTGETEISPTLSSRPSSGGTCCCGATPRATPAFRNKSRADTLSADLEAPSASLVIPGRRRVPMRPECHSSYFAFSFSASARFRSAAIVFSEWLTRFADFCRRFRFVTLCRFAILFSCKSFSIIALDPRSPCGPPPKVSLNTLRDGWPTQALFWLESETWTKPGKPGDRRVDCTLRLRQKN